MRALTTMNDDPTEPFKSSPAELFSSLRISTATLLKYDPDNLSAEQTIRIDRAVTLRLIIDHLQSRQMHGEQINVKEFVDASEALERMVGGNPDAPAREQRFGADHQAKLREMIARVVLTPSAVDHEREAALMWKEEQMALAAALPDWTWQPAPASLAAVSSHAADGDATVVACLVRHRRALPLAGRLQHRRRHHRRSGSRATASVTPA